MIKIMVQNKVRQYLNYVEFLNTSTELYNMMR